MTCSHWTTVCTRNADAIDLVRQNRFDEAQQRLKEAAVVLQNVIREEPRVDSNKGEPYRVEAVDVTLRPELYHKKDTDSITMLRIDAASSTTESSGDYDDAIAMALFNMSIVLQQRKQATEASARLLRLARSVLDSSPPSIRRFLVLTYVQQAIDKIQGEIPGLTNERPSNREPMSPE